MKLATIKSTHKRDGMLCVVSRDLSQAVLVPDIAATMQQALDDWNTSKIKLERVYEKLNADTLPERFAFDPQQCTAPLPRAYQWADGSAYVNHVELVRKARGVAMPESFWTDPLMYQGGSDAFIGPYDPIRVHDERYGIDFEAEVAVITDDVPMNVSKDRAGQHVQLLMLVNDVSLRNLIPDELAKGFGFFQSKPASSFSPVAITPDELGDAWKDSKVHLPLHSTLNGEWFGSPNAGIDMTFSFADLIAHAAKTRFLSTGTIIGSGTVSNNDRTTGSSCIAEKRMLELLDEGVIKTPFMSFGTTIRIEMLDNHGKSIFGAIDQQVIPWSGESS